MSSHSVCPTFKKVLVASVFGVCVFLVPGGVHSATSSSATLQWAANQEPDLAGYRVYHGTTSGNYGSPHNAGKTTSYQYTNLESNKSHYFSVTAYDTAGNESPPGLEVFKTVISSGGGDTPVVAWTAAGQNPGGTMTNSTFDNRSFRVLLEGAVISTSGSTVRLTFRGRSSGTYSMENISLVQRMGSTLNGVGPLTSVTYNGGATSVTVPEGGTVTSDPIAFNLVAGQDVFLTFWAPPGAPGVYMTGGTQTTAWFISGTDQSGTIDWEGLTISDTRPSIYNIELVEVLAESEALAITTQPSNVTVTEPATATFTVGATGATGYQWRRNGVNISGATNASYTTPPTTTAQSGDTFDVVVSNSVGIVTSAPASLTIINTDSLLSISISGEGTVSSNPGSVSCPSGSCSGTFPQGSQVTLTAAPSSGSTFSGWSGGGCSGTGSCVVTLSAASVFVNANFSSSPPPPSSSLSVTLGGDGKGSITSKPSGLTCSGGTCAGSFTQGTKVTLNPIAQSGSVFQGWNGVCSGTSSCAVTLSSSQVMTAVFAIEKSNPPPMPDLPFLVNFQPSASQTPTKFKKDDGSVFASTRGYGWNQLLNGTEQNTTADQTLDTFVSVTNLNPGTWSFAIPNGIYYVTMVLGDPMKAQGPHWVSAEGLQLAQQVTTASGEYLTIVDYPVEVKDSTLSLTFGNSGQGQTTLNYLVINEKPNLSKTYKTLVQSFGTTLVTSVLNPGEATKINPVVLVQNDLEEKEQIAKASAQEKAVAHKWGWEKQKEDEEAIINGIKEKMSSIKDSGGTVTLQNLLGGF